MIKNCAITLAVISTFLSSYEAVSQPYRDDAQWVTLETWKKNARTSPLGYPLVDLLSSCNSRLKENPHDKKSFFLRGYLFGILGCTSWAISDLSSAVAIDPSYAAAYTERGICYMDLGNLPLAQADLDRAVYLSPRSGDARYARGRLYLAMNKPVQARQEFANAQGMPFSPALPGELPGNFYDAPEYYLGRCLDAMGNGDGAVVYYKRALRAAGRYGGSGYLHRYADQPQDTTVRIAHYEPEFQR